MRFLFVIFDMLKGPPIILTRGESHVSSFSCAKILLSLFPFSLTTNCLNRKSIGAYNASYHLTRKNRRKDMFLFADGGLFNWYDRRHPRRLGWSKHTRWWWDGRMVQKTRIAMKNKLIAPSQRKKTKKVKWTTSVRLKGLRGLFLVFSRPSPRLFGSCSQVARTSEPRSMRQWKTADVGESEDWAGRRPWHGFFLGLS